MERPLRGAQRPSAHSGEAASPSDLGSAILRKFQTIETDQLCQVPRGLRGAWYASDGTVPRAVTPGTLRAIGRRPLEPGPNRELLRRPVPACRLP